MVDCQSVHYHTGTCSPKLSPPSQTYIKFYTLGDWNERLDDRIGSPTHPHRKKEKDVAPSPVWGYVGVYNDVAVTSCLLSKNHFLNSSLCPICFFIALLVHFLCNATKSHITTPLRRTINLWKDGVAVFLNFYTDRILASFNPKYGIVH